MNELHTGLDFHLSIRYGQITSTLFVCTMYSAGIPLLIPIALCMFAVSYWADKILLLRLYKTPPLYNEGLGRGMTGLLPYSMVVHLGFAGASWLLLVVCPSSVVRRPSFHALCDIRAVWMLGNIHIFEQNEWTIAQVDQATDAAGRVVDTAGLTTRISQRHVLPLFLLWVALVVILILTKLFRRIKLIGLKVLSCCMCGLLAVDDDLDRAFRMKNPRPSFSEAKRRHALRGLPSYNILKNPRFASAFAISASFAERHRTVRDVVKSPHSTSSHPDADVDADAPAKAMP